MICGVRIETIQEPTMPEVRYLKKLGDEGFTWTAENLDKWIADPKAMLPDSPMAQLFQGIPDAQERANIIAYLQTQ